VTAIADDTESKHNLIGHFVHDEVGGWNLCRCLFFSL